MPDLSPMICEMPNLMHRSATALIVRSQPSEARILSLAASNCANKSLVVFTVIRSVLSFIAPTLLLSAAHVNTFLRSAANVR